MKVIFTLFILALSLGAHADPLIPEPRIENQPADLEYKPCETTREFVTSLEYLRDQKDLGLDEREMRKVSYNVAKGCKGAAKRFSWSFEILMKTDAGPRSALELAQELAQKNNQYTEAFVGIFTRSYLAEYLDLDYNTALSIAKSLSTDYSGDPKIALADFVELTDFCSQETSLGLSKPRCGIIAGRIVKSAEKFRLSVAKNFRQLFNFMTTDKQGPAATLIDALRICENVAAVSPEAPANFIQGFKYAVDEKGLNFDATRSIDFATKIAGLAKFDPNRLPASLREELPQPKE